MQKTITLMEALTGYTLSFEHLDGKQYSFPIRDVIQPNMVKTVPNLGMPISRSPGQFGMLRVKFNVRFPQVSASQRSQGAGNFVFRIEKTLRTWSDCAVGMMRCSSVEETPCSPGSGSPCKCLQHLTEDQQQMLRACLAHS